MALPELNMTVKDGALGIAPSNTNGVQACVGVSSAGVVGTVYQFGDLQTLKDTLGQGPLVELAALVLASGGGPVVCVKTAAGTAGTNSAVAAGGANTGASVLTLTGTPLDSYQGIVQVVTGAANPAAGTAVVRYSLDGGRTYGPDIAVPTGGVYPVPGAGVSLNFSAATLVAGDTYTFSSTGPAYTVGELNSALDALLANPATWFVVNIVGVPAASGTAAVAGAVATKMATAEAQYRYAFALMQAEDSSDATLITAAAALSSTRLAIAAGFANITSVVSGASYKRPAAWAAAIALARSNPGEDPSKVRKGGITAVQTLLRDEFKTPALDAVRFATLRTFIDRQGFYLSNLPLMAPAGSDFKYAQFRRVMDIACRIARFAGLNYLNDTVRVDKDTGYILEADARAIDVDIEEQVRTAVLQPGFVSDATVRTNRLTNILSSGRLPITIRLVPLGYLKAIDVEIGFLNPALTRI